MKKVLLPATFCLLLCGNAMAQVPKRILLEHFTNTVCPPCANRNPALYHNLADDPHVYHLSYHPSAPYPSCTLHQHNPSENDARTNYYGVYGSTPRLALQGIALPGNTAFADPALFNSALGQFSSFDIVANLILLNPTTLRLTVTISKEDTSSLTVAGLYGAIAEDTLNFTSPNGENNHYHVFRKAVWNADTMNIPLPPLVNTSISMMKDIPVNNAWDLNKIYAMVVLQDNNGIIQVVKSNDLANTLSVATASGGEPVNIYPNPAGEYITISGLKAGDNVIVRDINGSLIKSVSISSPDQLIDVLSLSGGIYLLSIQDGKSVRHAKLVKQ